MKMEEILKQHLEELVVAVVLLHRVLLAEQQIQMEVLLEDLPGRVEEGVF